MASLFQLRRGTTAEKPTLAAGELYVNTTSQSLQVGIDGATEVTLVKLNSVNSGSLNVSGDITLGGTITIGDSTSDNVVFNADLSSSIIPNDNDAYDLGSPTKVYRNVYATSITGAIAATNGIVSGAAQITPLLPTGTVSGSSQITVVLPTGVISGSSQLSGTTIATLTITNLTTVNETASVVFSSGSNTFGDAGNDTHRFTGSVQISGSLIVTGSFTASLANGYTWVGDGSNTSILVATSSFGGSLPLGVVSGSSQIVYGDISSIPSDIVSGAAQITPLLPIGTISSSAQITGFEEVASTSHTLVSGSSQVIGILDSLNTFSASVQSGANRIVFNNGSNVTTSSANLTFNGTTVTNNATSGTFEVPATVGKFASALDATNHYLPHNGIGTSILRTGGADKILIGYGSAGEIRLSGSVVVPQGITGEIRATNGVVSGSSQLTSSYDLRYTLSGSYNTDSQSFDSRIINLAVAGVPVGTVSGSSQLTSSYDLRYTLSSSYNSDSQSFDQRIINLAVAGVPVGTVSGSAQIITVLDGIHVVSSSAQITGFEEVASTSHTLVSGSSQVSYTGLSSIPANIVSGAIQVLGGSDIISGAAQITPLLPIGVVSGSSQVIGSSITTNTVSFNGTSVALGSTGTILNLVSGSSQITYTGLSGIPADIVSGAIQVLGGSNVVSSSAQITPLLPIGTVSGSSQVSYTGLSSIPANIVSGAAQITPLLPIGTVSSSVQVLGGTGIHSASAGDYQFNSIGVGTAGSTVAGEIRATADITAYYSSDIRLKENIQSIPNALDKVTQISGNTYDWKAGFESIHSHTGHDVGVIAQEIEKVLPELVTDRETGYKAVQYEKIVALLIEAIKELSVKVNYLEDKLNEQSEQDYII